MIAWIALAPPVLLVIGKATLLLGVAALVNGMAGRRLSAAQRHLMWTVTLVGVLLLPFASAVLPAWTLRPNASGAAPVWRMGVPEAVVSDAAPAGAARTSPPVSTASNQSATRAKSESADTTLARSETLERFLMLLYGAGVLLMLARLAVQYIAVRRLERCATLETDASWTLLLDELRVTLRVARPVRLLRSETAMSAMTWGVRTPTILLPMHANAWSPERRRAVLLHELAHVARWDCLTQTLAALAESVYWLHPGVWWAAGRLRVERELACDDAVLAAGMAPRQYAAELLHIARAAHAVRGNILALAFHEPSLLEGRMRAILDNARRRSAPRRTTVLICAALAGTVFAAVTAAQPAIRGASMTLKEEIRIGGSTPELRFDEVQSMAVGSNGAMFIADSGGTRVRMYDATGKFVRTVGSRGTAPGQYRDVTGMLVTPRGELAVYDVFNKRISFYDAAGRFARSMPSQVGGNWTGNDFHVDRQGNLYVFGVRYLAEGRAPTAQERAKSQRFFLKLSPEGAVLDTVDIPSFTGPREPGGFVIMTPEAYLVPFSTPLAYDIAPTGELVWGYTKEYQFEIGQRSGRSIPVRRDVAPVPLGVEERAEWQARATYYNKEGARSASYGTIIPERKPAYRDIEVAEDGRIWVHRYSAATKRTLTRPRSDSLPPPLTWREIPTFDVFEADGRFAGTVILPENTRLFARRGAQLWGAQVNANRETVVVRYRME
jgi:beta-lactamase regulating signal transducer with metallopeptidase domain